MKFETLFSAMLLCLTYGLTLTASEEYSPQKRDPNIKHYLADYHYRTAPLLPVDLTEFYFSPGKPQAISLKLNNNYQWGNIHNIVYNIYDYRGSKFDSGKAEVISGKVKLNLKLPQGYYELSFPKYKESFGICSLPAYSGKRDPFFGIGSYLTFYVRRQFREPIIKNLARCGIYSVRETCKWDDLSPAINKWQWQGRLKVGGQVVKHEEQYRKLLKKYDIKLLEMCGAVPKWMKLPENSEYPENLINLVNTWRQWAVKWKRYWDCFQVWNEPNHDGHKGNVAEFASLVKAIAWVAQQQKIKVTNGGFAFCDLNYIKQCKLNGMLDSISYISFHIYDNAESIPEILKKYRQIIPDKELWITETSKGFYHKNIYSKRPEKLSEQMCCLDNAKNIIASKAGGVSRYYPFSLISWPTDKKQLTRRKFYANGCLDYHYTPLRYMAVYAQSIRMLSGRKYLGEIDSKDSRLKPFRIFADHQNAVIVLAAAKHNNKVIYKFKPALKNIRVEGIDGRKLKADNNSISLDDGLIYIILDPAQFKKIFSTRLKPAIKIHNTTKSKTLSPVILQPSFSSTDKYITTKNYLKINKALKNFEIKIKINNLSSAPKTISLNHRTSSSSLQISGTEETVSIPPQSTLEKKYSITINTKEATDVLNECQISFPGTDSDGLKVLPLNYALRIISNDLDDYRRLAKNIKKVDLNNLNRWERNHIIKGGLMRIFINPQKQFCMQVKFKKYKNIRTWAAPRYLFDKYKSILTPKSIILIRGKLKNFKNNLQLLMYENDGTRYETKLPINDKTNKGWQIMPVFFSDFQRSRGTFDENQNLDLNQVNKIGISILCPHHGEMKDNELLISDFYIIN
jgi:hypothetical protein